MSLSKKDQVPRYESETPEPDAPTRSDVLNAYGLGHGQVTDEEREMREWEEKRAAQFDRNNQPATDGATSRVPLADLSPNPDNPRGVIDAKDPDFEGLSKSVASLGVVQALTVCTREAFLRHHPQHAGVITRMYVVIAGHRRLQAAWLAGCADVPVLVNDEAAENPLMWAVAENLQRVGLNPMQEARSLSGLVEVPPNGKGLSQTAVANGIGKTQGFVSQRMALLKLTAPIQDLVLAGELKVKRGVLLAKLASDEQQPAEESLRALVPELQAELDGGKLNDIQLALKVAQLPAAQQMAARQNKGVPPQDTATERKGRTAARVVPTVSLRQPEQIADDLARLLPTEQLVQLAELLQERATAP
ncbi:ParB/RepB/Spo0J family partition protein [Streptomyces sp. NPDC050738]|uniref:ParB/RepB/Spo0J family partition protein n=1 Tax=Streptomyces sp. NPDC050738 TaxID=3154744 RepID=UPI0034182CFF